MRFWLSFALISLASGACLAADTPAQAAITFAEALRDDLEKEKLLEICALNPDTGDRKKEQIMTAWKGYTKKLLPLSFRVAEEKISGDYAAVILTQEDHSRIGSPNLISLAIVKSGDKWLAAPVPSSFQNTIASYDPSVLEQRRKLEHWMLGREVFLREEMQLAAKKRFIEKMQQSITEESLKTISPNELWLGLIQAIQQRDHAAALARLGGYASDSTPQWDKISQRIQSLFSSGGLQKWPWRLLASQQSLMGIAPAVDFGDEKAIDILILHPESLSEEPDYFSIAVQYDEQGRARIVMPDVFWMRNATEDEFGEIMNSEDEEQLALYDSIYQQARKGIKDLNLSRASVLADVIEKSLQQNDFATFWATGAAPASMSQLVNMPGMIQLWQELQGSAFGSSLFGRVGFREHKNYALLVLQSYSPRNTNAIQLQRIWLERKKETWILLDQAPETPPDELMQWWSDHRKPWSQKLADTLVAGTTRIGGLAPKQPDVAQVREAFDGWLKALQDRSLSKVIPFCAAFQDDRSIQSMMRALAGELMYGAGRHEVLEVSAHGRWAAVSAKYQSERAKSAPQYPLYVFVATDQGPRMLAQVELKLGISGNRSRNYLNNLAFNDLKKLLPDAAVDELKFLYDKHAKLVEQQSQMKP